MTNESEYGGNRYLAEVLRADPMPGNKIAFVTLGAGQVLVDAGQTIREVYFPIGGLVSVLALSAEGDEVEAAAVGRDGIVALPMFGRSAVSPFRLSVTIESKAFRIAWDDLARLADSSAALHTRIDACRLQLAAEYSRSLVCNSLHRIAQRASRWLLAAAQRTGSDLLPVTQDRLSLLLGVRRPTVTDVIQSFVAQGFLEVSRGKISIRDRTGLRGAACDCIDGAFTRSI